LFQQRACQVELGDEVSAITFDRMLEGTDGTRNVAPSLKRDTEAVVRLGITRIYREGSFDTALSPFEHSSDSKSFTTVSICLSAQRIDHKRLPDQLDGTVLVASLVGGHAQQMQSIEVSCVATEDVQVHPFRLIESACSMVLERGVDLAALGEA
jgi:hypothetical protein